MSRLTVLQTIGSDSYTEKASKKDALTNFERSINNYEDEFYEDLYEYSIGNKSYPTRFN